MPFGALKKDFKMTYQYYRQWDDLDESIKDQDDDLDIDIDHEEQEENFHNCMSCDECLG